MPVTSLGSKPVEEILATYPTLYSYRPDGILGLDVLINDPILTRLVRIKLPKFCTTFDGEKDHVHLLINYPPKISIAKLVNSLKGVSSRMLRKKNYPEIMQNLWGNMLWSPSYFAGSCGGAPLEIIKQYIQQQQTPL